MFTGEIAVNAIGLKWNQSNLCHLSKIYQKYTTLHQYFANNSKNWGAIKWSEPCSQILIVGVQHYRPHSESDRSSVPVSLNWQSDDLPARCMSSGKGRGTIKTAGEWGARRVPESVAAIEKWNRKHYLTAVVAIWPAKLPLSCSFRT